MFRDSNYDITEFSIAANGMNQFISPDVLPSNFCHLLENIIPCPLGVGQVRYGTKFINNVSTSEFNIIRSFPFTLDGSIKQAILYVGYYLQDLNTDNRVAVDSSHITFNSVPPPDYVSDTKIKIEYTFNDVPNTLYSDIKEVSIAVNAVSITLENNVLPDPTSGILIITGIWYQLGSIYSYNFGTPNIPPILKIYGLSVACVPRVAYFQQKMLICNGVDNVMFWDGNVIEDVSEFIVETQANTFIRIGANSFSFNVININVFNILKYFDDNLIKLNISGTVTQLTILDAALVGNIVTVTTVENTIPVFSPQISLSYQDKPPAFSYIYIAKDRIWALGPGATSLQYRESGEQLRVYYSYRPDAVSGYGLFNENLKIIPSIEMSDKYTVQDNFEAICQVNGMLAFMGRKHTQVWSGDTPGNNGNFAWHANLPVGIFHGDLLIELSNNVYFVSQFGVQSFTTLNIGNQFSATSDNAVDTIVKKLIFDASISNANYRKCTSFKYEKGWIAGFKISNNKILASLFSTSLYSWFYLSGDFRSANCFIDLGNQFYLCIGNKIYKYSDGADGSTKIYGDKDGLSLIPITWIPGLVKFRNKKGYANKRYEISVNYPSSFILNKNNYISVSIFGDDPRSFSLTDKCNFQQRGDLIGQEPLTVLEENNDMSPGFRLRKEYEIVNKRLKFSAVSFWLSVSGYVINGPVTFRTIKLFGIGERNG